MSHNDYPTPEAQQPTPLEQLTRYVDQVLPEGPGAPESVTRYILGFADRTITITRDSETGDRAIDYNDSGSGPSRPLEEHYGFHSLSVLTKDGRLLDTSGEKTDPGYDHERDFTPMLLEGLQQTTDKPVKTMLGRLMLLRKLTKS